MLIQALRIFEVSENIIILYHINITIVCHKYITRSDYTTSGLAYGVAYVLPMSAVIIHLISVYFE